MFFKKKWILNVVLIAVPYSALGLGCVAFNVILNLIFNKFWAGGNIFLIANTVYLIMQYFLSILVIWEIGPWLKYVHYVRLFSLLSSYLYSLLYIAALVRYFSLILEWDGREPDVDELFLVCVIGYNLVLHSTVIPVNFAIAIKEFSMEWF